MNCHVDFHFQDRPIDQATIDVSEPMPLPSLTFANDLTKTKHVAVAIATDGRIAIAPFNEATVAIITASIAYYSMLTTLYHLHYFASYGLSWAAFSLRLSVAIKPSARLMWQAQLLYRLIVSKSRHRRCLRSK